MDSLEFIEEEDTDEQEPAKGNAKEEAAAQDPSKGKAKGKSKKKLHLYRFRCWGHELREWGISAEITCEDCSVAVLYLISNPVDYFEDVHEKLVNDHYNCVKYHESLESDLKDAVEDCIENLGAISKEEIAILTKFDMLD